MAAEPGYLSSHTASTGTSFVQTSPNVQASNGETAVTAGQLMSINPADGNAYLCDVSTVNCVPAGFAATDNPAGTTVDDTTKITLVRQGRIKGFSGLVPGALYYPSADTAGTVVPEQGIAGAVITAVTADSGSGFLRNVHVREGNRPAAGDWVLTFPTATTCTVTAPGGSATAASIVADSTSYDGAITGASDFYIETAALTSGDSATITVAYDSESACVVTLDSPGNAFTALTPISGMGGRIMPKGIYKLVSTATNVSVGINGASQSAAKTIAAGENYFDIVPGAAVGTEAGAVTAETNYVLVSAQSPVAPVGLAVNDTTLQVFMGGNG